jgi:hypothetical protein
VLKRPYPAEKPEEKEECCPFDFFEYLVGERPVRTIKSDAVKNVTIPDSTPMSWAKMRRIIQKGQEPFSWEFAQIAGQHLNTPLGLIATRKKLEDTRRCQVITKLLKPQA